MARREVLSYNTKNERKVFAEIGEKAAAIGMAAIVLKRASHIPELRLQGELLSKNNSISYKTLKKKFLTIDRLG